MKFKPAPGIIFIKPQKEKSAIITTTGKNNNRLIKGQVIEKGTDVKVDGENVYMNNYAMPGDIVYFLSYEGDYDNFEYKGEKYYVVKYEDIRGKIDEQD